MNIALLFINSTKYFLCCDTSSVNARKSNIDRRYKIENLKDTKNVYLKCLGNQKRECDKKLSQQSKEKWNTLLFTRKKKRKIKKERKH